ncbi:MAG TPA: NADH-quinone oxidoreductase subunit NuoE [Candidatus Cloacimonadota bacterium]|nr:NADH-quinone oxidoreductase subunit NuoE [Candidatus Cloacimonadota bacterium]HPT73159.1 NADH-quinone oxidoreductase subunit NuoE [Candidatus Cloacimonadota bacterium]
MQTQELDQIIAKYHNKKGSLIPLMQEAQRLEGFLSRETMQYLADHTGVAVADIYGVATFYSMFRLRPQGKHTIRVCKGTACHVSGANALIKGLRDYLKLESDQDTSEDGIFTVMEVACLGCCSLAPVIMIDDATYGTLNADLLPAILEKYTF